MLPINFTMPRTNCGYSPNSPGYRSSSSEIGDIPAPSRSRAFAIVPLPCAIGSRSFGNPCCLTGLRQAFAIHLQHLDVPEQIGDLLCPKPLPCCFCLQSSLALVCEEFCPINGTEMRQQLKHSLPSDRTNLRVEAPPFSRAALRHGSIADPQ